MESGIGSRITRSIDGHPVAAQRTEWTSNRAVAVKVLTEGDIQNAQSKSESDCSKVGCPILQLECGRYCAAARAIGGEREGTGSGTTGRNSPIVLRSAGRSYTTARLQSCNQIGCRGRSVI